MKCPFCEKEIEEGSLYCNHCGNAIQVVPDYNILEDDVLPAIVSAKDQKKSKDPGDQTKEDAGRKHPWLPWVITLLIVLFGVLAVVLVLRYRSSFAYLKAQGDEAFYSETYGDAISYYTRALDIEPENTKVLLSLGNAQNAAGYFEEAKATYGHVLLIDADDLEAFQALVLLVFGQNDNEGLEALTSIAKTAEQKDFLELYMISAPEFSLPGGGYEDNVTIELTAEEGDAIYYTLDGSEPSSHNGTLYEEPISLTKQGTTIVSAVAIDDVTGKSSAIVSQNFEIDYVAPAQPTVSPEGGRLDQETYVTIVPESEDDRIFFTWDGTMPTVNSARYSEPILVPEGNNILTIIAIDSHNMTSDVLRVNFIYLP